MESTVVHCHGIDHCAELPQRTTERVPSIHQLDQANTSSIRNCSEPVLMVAVAIQATSTGRPLDVLIPIVMGDA